MDELLDGLRAKPRTNKEEDWHMEQKRKSFDTIRIKYPKQVIVRGIQYTLPNKNFFIEYDLRQYQKVPYGATVDTPRFRAMWYVEHMKDLIVNHVNKTLHDEHIEDRAKKGLPAYTSIVDENNATYSTQQYPRTDDKVVMAEIYNQLWVGLVNEAGRDVPTEDEDPRAGETSRESASTQVLKGLANKRVAPEDNPVIGQQGISMNPIERKPVESRFAALNQKLDVNDITEEDV